jgi:hypothetical protein
MMEKNIEVVKKDRVKASQRPKGYIYVCVYIDVMGLVIWNDLSEEAKLKELKQMLTLLDDPNTSNHSTIAKKLIYIAQGKMSVWKKVLI